MRSLEAFIRLEFFRDNIIPSSEKPDNHPDWINNLAMGYNIDAEVILKQIDGLSKDRLVAEWKIYTDWRIRELEIRKHNNVLYTRFVSDFKDCLVNFGADIYKTKGDLKSMYGVLINDIGSQYDNTSVINREYLPNTVYYKKQKLDLPTGSTVCLNAWVCSIITNMKYADRRNHMDNLTFARHIEFCIKYEIDYNIAGEMCIVDFKEFVVTQYRNICIENMKNSNHEIKINTNVCSCERYIAGSKTCSCGSKEMSHEYYNWIYKGFTISDYINDISDVDYPVPILTLSSVVFR